MSIVAIAGTAFTYYLPGLESQGTPGTFQTAPTIGAADFTISTNGGAFEAMDNTPTVTPAGGTQICFILSAAETTAAGDGGQINIRCSDAAGAEWYDCGICVPVRAADLAVVGSAMTLADNAITAAKIAADAIGSSELAASAASEIAAAVIAGGAGTYSNALTINDGSNPLDGVFIQVSTDSGKTNIIWAGYTNSLGQVTAYSDTAGTHYAWMQLSGYTFTNPTSITMA